MVITGIFFVTNFVMNLIFTAYMAYCEKKGILDGKRALADTMDILLPVASFVLAVYFFVNLW